MQAETQDWGEEVGKALLNHIGAREKDVRDLNSRIRYHGLALKVD